MENPFARSVSRRSVQTASQRRSDFDSLLVTHPFHPLAGQRLTIIFQRRLKQGGMGYVCDGGALGNTTLPESFTDRGMPPERGPLTGEILAGLVLLLKNLQKRLDSQG